MPNHSRKCLPDLDYLLVHFDCLPVCSPETPIPTPILKTLTGHQFQIFTICEFRRSFRKKVSHGVEAMAQ